MLAKRIIPCLDVKDGRVVKGVNFVNLRDAGDPVEQAHIYDRMGADELVFLDISATYRGHQTVIDIVRSVADQVFMPLTVGGGIRTVSDMRDLLLAGADKVSVNSAALANPELLVDASERFGSQCIVLAIDARETKNDDSVFNTPKWEVFVSGGRENTGIDVLEWVERGVSLGAGEILLTSMNTDGVMDGFDMELTHTVANLVNVPVIASGGAGKTSHFAEILGDGCASAALAASVFHDKILTISEVKQFLSDAGIAVRL
jgi:cyclase